jgi:hypothetical protein
MPVKTTKVSGRRELHFNSLDEVVADAGRLVASPSTKMLGNRTLGELLAHLAVGINNSFDGASIKVPWIVRMLAPLFKQRLVSRPMSPGFNLPEAAETLLYPPVASAQEGLERLQAAVGRARTEKMTAKNPVLGKLTEEQWKQLHLRHAELHLSFAAPG